MLAPARAGATARVTLNAMTCYPAVVLVSRNIAASVVIVVVIIIIVIVVVVGMVVGKRASPLKASARIPFPACGKPAVVQGWGSINGTLRGARGQCAGSSCRCYCCRDTQSCKTSTDKRRRRRGRRRRRRRSNRGVKNYAASTTMRANTTTTTTGSSCAAVPGKQLSCGIAASGRNSSRAGVAGG